jgi:hypothetical protein
MPNSSGRQPPRAPPPAGRPAPARRCARPARPPGWPPAGGGVERGRVSPPGGPGPRPRALRRHAARCLLRRDGARQQRAARAASAGDKARGVPLPPRPAAPRSRRWRPPAAWRAPSHPAAARRTRPAWCGGGLDGGAGAVGASGWGARRTFGGRLKECGTAGEAAVQPASAVPRGDRLQAPTWSGPSPNGSSAGGLREATRVQGLVGRDSRRPAAVHLAVPHLADSKFWRLRSSESSCAVTSPMT